MNKDDNILNFPNKEEDLKRLAKKGVEQSFNFHKTRLEKLLNELQYEVHRLYQDPEFRDEDVNYKSYVTSHTGKPVEILFRASTDTRRF